MQREAEAAQERALEPDDGDETAADILQPLELIPERDRVVSGRLEGDDLWTINVFVRGCGETRARIQRTGRRSQRLLFLRLLLR